MKYKANPVLVDASRIVSIGPKGHRGDFHCALEDGKNVIATAEMCSRFEPTIGDYWVVQQDGYVYLNPAEVFERKYSPVEG